MPGFLLNQWAMSERGGVLRVASTQSPTWLGNSETRGSELRDDARPPRGQPRPAGSGRRARQGRAHLFRSLHRRRRVRGDLPAGRPLTPSISPTPADPRVRGELKIRGYSAYLHPVGPDLLLGVGQDASERGQRLGTQLSLFDVSDVAAPRPPAPAHRRARRVVRRRVRPPRVPLVGSAQSRRAAGRVLHRSGLLHRRAWLQRGAVVRHRRGSAAPPTRPATTSRRSSAPSLWVGASSRCPISDSRRTTSQTCRRRPGLSCRGDALS